MFGVYYPLSLLTQIAISLATLVDMYQIIYPKNLTRRHSLNQLGIEGMNGVFCENLEMRIYIQKSFQTNLGISN